MVGSDVGEVALRAAGPPGAVQPLEPFGLQSKCHGRPLESLKRLEFLRKQPLRVQHRE